MAQSIPQKVPFTRVTEEVGRLAQRSMTGAETAIVHLLVDGCSVWADGLRPESLAHLAVAYAAGVSKKVLFISPNSDLLEHRQLRLGPRGPCAPLHKATRLRDAAGLSSSLGSASSTRSTGSAGDASRSMPLTAWASPDALEASLLARVFGPNGPDLIVLEEAQSCSSLSYAYRPSWGNLKDLLAKWPQAALLASAPSSEESLRQSVSQVLGVNSLKKAQTFTDSAYAKARKSKAWLVVEDSLFSGAVQPSLSPLHVAGETDSTLRAEFTGEPQTPRDEEGESSEDGPCQFRPAAPALPLHLQVQDDENQSLPELIGPLPRPALVLCGTPAQADQVFAELEAEQIPVHRFHSGLSSSERARELVHFALPGRRAVMIAVSAFGPESGFAGSEGSSMPESFGRGYAREDLRSIVHLCAPCSISQYAQELGLLSPSPPCHEGEEEPRRNVALMLFSPAHLALNLALLGRKRPVPETLEFILDFMLSQRGDSWIDEEDFDAQAAISRRDLRVCLRFLQDIGVIEYSGTQIRTIVAVELLKSATGDLARSFVELIDGDEARLTLVEEYARTNECRLTKLNSLLGREPVHGNCGVCDVCAPDHAQSSTVERDTQKRASAEMPARKSPAKRRARSGDSSGQRERRGASRSGARGMLDSEESARFGS